MNPDSPEFAEQLRQATSRESASALDAELTALRSVFLALGRALESATDDANERRLIAGLTETPEAEIAIVGLKSHASSETPRTTIWLAATAALLLLSIGIVAYATRTKLTPDQVAQPDKTPPKVAPAIVEPELELPVPEVTSDLPQLANDDPAMFDDDEVLGWDDSLDDSFAAAERLVSQVGRLSSAAEARVETLHKRIQAASEDMQAGSL